MIFHLYLIFVAKYFYFFSALKYGMSLATFGNGQGGVSLGGIRYRSASYNFPETSSANKCTAHMTNTKEHSKEICYVKVGKLKERKKCLDNRVRIVKGENVENTTTQ